MEKNKKMMQHADWNPMKTDSSKTVSDKVYFTRSATGERDLI